MNTHSDWYRYLIIIFGLTIVILLTVNITLTLQNSSQAIPTSRKLLSEVKFAFNSAPSPSGMTQLTYLTREQRVAFDRDGFVVYEDSGSTGLKLSEEHLDLYRDTYNTYSLAPLNTIKVCQIDTNQCTRSLISPQDATTRSYSAAVDEVGHRVTFSLEEPSTEVDSGIIYRPDTLNLYVFGTD